MKSRTWNRTGRVAARLFLLTTAIVGVTVSSVGGVVATSWVSQEPVVQIRIARTIKSVTYRPNSGQTTIGLQGTPLQARTQGRARIQSRQGVTQIEGELSRLGPASSFGAPYLTYVLWAITPEGSASNLGELVLNGSSARIKASTNLLSFGLIVTAEPYFAISVPSEIVVAENVILPETTGKIEAVDAKYELLERGKYEAGVFQAQTIDPKVPLELYQARNAAQIGQWLGVERYATESWSKAMNELQNAEGYQSRRDRNTRSVLMTARDAVQIFEDARLIALKRQEEERLANERRTAQERQARARAEAEAQTERRKEEEEARRRAEAERELEAIRRERAETEKLKAELAATLESQRRAEAEAARARAVAEQELARRAAEEARQREEVARRNAETSRLAAEAARQAAERAERERAELRARLLNLFNSVLETRDTDRGLVIQMGDVLFDTGRFTLRQPAREKLARLAGIVLNYPDLILESEGHTDNVGGETFNQKLSEQRAQAVRDYLVSQGVPSERITSVGKGFTVPVADNRTVAGRQQNRRVELIVSGEVIGTQIK
jgi:outer membrane protein OmpA-like peptidoglycan-associated protein